MSFVPVSMLRNTTQQSASFVPGTAALASMAWSWKQAPVGTTSKIDHVIFESLKIYITSLKFRKKSGPPVDWEIEPRKTALTKLWVAQGVSWTFPIVRALCPWAVPVRLEHEVNKNGFNEHDSSYRPSVVHLSWEILAAAVAHPETLILRGLNLRWVQALNRTILRKHMKTQIQISETAKRRWFRGPWTSWARFAALKLVLNPFPWDTPRRPMAIAVPLAMGERCGLPRAGTGQVALSCKVVQPRSPIGPNVAVPLYLSFISMNLLHFDQFCNTTKNGHRNGPAQFSNVLRGNGSYLEHGWNPQSSQWFKLNRTRGA